MLGMSQYGRILISLVCPEYKDQANALGGMQGKGV